MSISPLSLFLSFSLSLLFPQCRSQTTLAIAMKEVPLTPHSIAIIPPSRHPSPSIHPSSLIHPPPSLLPPPLHPSFIIHRHHQSPITHHPSSISNLSAISNQEENKLHGYTHTHTHTHTHTSVVTSASSASPSTPPTSISHPQSAISNHHHHHHHHQYHMIGQRK
jgi:hypothetical protein